jgi:CheY-like chemotaxis protein
MAKKILVIDDEELVSKTLLRYLKACGYNVEAAASGQEAMKKFESSSFDLVIADVRMPGMDGIETIKKLREISQSRHQAKTPEIIITGFASEDTKKEADALGISSYIYKPFEVTTFLDAIKKNLGE